MIFFNSAKCLVEASGSSSDTNLNIFTPNPQGSPTFSTRKHEAPPRLGVNSAGGRDS